MRSNFEKFAIDACESTVQSFRMLIGAFLPILELASLVTEKPVGDIFGKNICWISLPHAVSLK